MSLANEPEQKLVQELEGKLKHVADSVAAIRRKSSEQRRNMTLGDILNECVAKKEKVADDFLDAVLSLQLYEHPNGKNVNQVDVVKMLTGAEPALRDNRFRTALNALISFLKEWEKLDASEAAFKKLHEFDQLEAIHKQLLGQLIEAHGPAAALSVLEVKIERLYAGTAGEREFVDAMRASIDGSATAEKQAPRLQKAYKAEPAGSEQRDRLKNGWRIAQGLEGLYLDTSTARPYAVLRERIQPYRRYLMKNHKDVLKESRVKMVSRMGGNDTSSSTAPIQEASMGHLSLRQRHIYFGRHRRDGHW
ncbi:uncharacterized protein RHOBADRAFT_41670 [Rhodotorula graminis WP1]|uniref:Uncharacterized protein n=1 Tax=Rhodotorula graminis (strain WP1) TaxID=578459 RepID=A0A194SAQ7_RHOGW|nr:uncharacterized protein RHOBADRAFT_41670 [Rhodotorula graminis WP1]KPV77674.1 hypothetical protein RHOBADRAFT_41670 [Rhodotorula graminis WP1]